MNENINVVQRSRDRGVRWLICRKKSVYVGILGNVIVICSVVGSSARPSETWGGGGLHRINASDDQLCTYLCGDHNRLIVEFKYFSYGSWHSVYVH